MGTSLNVTCPECDTVLEASASAVGKKVRCPRCRNVMTLRAPVIETEVLEDPETEDALVNAAASYSPRSAPARPAVTWYGERNDLARRSALTIEKTGKVFKAHMLLGFLVVVVGLAVVAISRLKPDPDPDGWLPGFIVSAVGAAWFAIARALAWWHHG